MKPRIGLKQLRFRVSVQLVLGLSLGAVALGERAAAQQSMPTGPPDARIARIEVEGNQRVTTENILQWFAVRPGDRFDPRRVERALKDLTRKGRFADVEIEGELEDESVVLYITVEEYPQLQAVRIEGVDKLKESDLRAEMTLGARAFLTPWQLREDIGKITRLYRDKGYHRAGVRDTLVLASNGEFDLVLRVLEGEKASIQQIVFVGNEQVLAKHLRKQMETSEDGFWGGGDLKMDVLEQDFQKIADFYQTRGYLDAHVTQHELDLAENGRDLTLRIHIEEGQQYRVGMVSWVGNTVFPDERIRAVLQLHRGRPFDQSLYDASTTALYELYQDRGYFYFTASPSRDVQGETVNVVYELQEGQQARLNHVRIVGNTKTQDKVILREFVLLPGDTFDRSRLTRSLREVFQLGFFDDVNIPPEGIRPREDGSVDVDLRVAERQTGQLGAGAGYSAVNALTGFFEMAETNLFGTGKRLSLRWEFSKRRNDINFSYTQPWFMDTPTTMTVDLFSSTGRTNVASFYRVRRTGGALSIGRRLNVLDFTTVFWRYRAERVKFEDFAASIPDSTRLELARGNRRFSTGLTLRRNSTDNPFFPSRGSEAEVSTNLVGTFLGGDEHYIRNEAQLSWFQRIGFSKFTFMLRSRFGHLRGLGGHRVPNDELFRLGGVFFNGVRGYDELQIVPEGNPPFQGGQAMSIFVSELRYPFSPRFHGSVFFDAGNTWNTFREADFSNLRKGAGVGVRVEVPMLGLLGLDYAYGFDRVDLLGRDDDGWKFHFRFGNLF
jgi:outer membrane protein insertion porin family